MTTYGLPRTWTEGGVTHHEAFGKRTTIWVDCAACDKRQPAGTETLNAFNEEPYMRITLFRFDTYRVRQIGQCSVCSRHGPLVQIKLISTGSVSRTRCDRRCLDARGDECNCGVCLGRDHGTGSCTCGKETP